MSQEAVEWALASYLMGEGPMTALLVTPWDNAHVGHFNAYRQAKELCAAAAPTTAAAHPARTTTTQARAARAPVGPH